MSEYSPELSFCFRDPVVRFGDGAFVLSHCPLLRRLLILFLLGSAVSAALGVAALVTPWGRSYAWTDFWVTAVPLILIFGVPTLMFIALKPAHSFRSEVFPFKGVVYRRRYWFGIRISSRRSQIGAASDGFVVHQVVAEFREDVGPTVAGENLLECLYYLMGPFIAMIRLFLPNPEIRIRREPMFLLYTSAGIESGLPPIACFYAHADAAAILKKIEMRLRVHS